MVNRRFNRTGLLVAILPSLALAQSRLCQWNISQYGTSTGGYYRDPYYQRVLFNSNPANGFHIIPDILAVEEVASVSAASRFNGILNAGWLSIGGTPTNDYQPGGYVTGPTTSSMLYYRASKFKLIRTVTVYLPSGSTSDQPNPTMRYDLQPVGYSADSTIFSVYVIHTKSGTSAASGSTPSDSDIRWLETKRIRNDAANLNNQYSFIACGDYNVQSSTTNEYLELVKYTSTAGSPNGRFFDPTSSAGSWHKNGAFKTLQTQEPGTGLNDRFDQILMSSSWFDGAGLDYIGNYLTLFSSTNWNDPNHSYRVVGNDGSTDGVTQPMNTATNTQLGPSLASDLAQTCKQPNSTSTSAGHLPVFIDFRVPPKISCDTAELNFGTIIRGRSITASIAVSNSGDTALFGSNGISPLHFTVSGSGVSVPTGSFTVSAGAPASLSVTFSASTAGNKSGVITINSDAPDQPILTIPWRAVVSNGGGLH